ncbi:protein-glutamine gamma-glutamyltransferase E-like isoform X1 [Gambusia affinis]|uniref:protein-glutamine gamma-glutamyltransferase E-like isoform X1 n=1 Tax=Gambusia affinis TaxID=33528 RepID=UPI001CDB89C6|nr:protein-glutamine gamma-glutamyltransferase E-like isoform X1 [Gambusia affinis]
MNGMWLGVTRTLKAASAELSGSARLVSTRRLSAHHPRKRNATGAAMSLNGPTDYSSVFRSVDLHSDTNNIEHHTSEISVTELIVRRGQTFKLTFKLTQPFNLSLDQLIMTVETGNDASEDLGTKSRFGVPDLSLHSASAKAAWKAEVQRSSSPETGVLVLVISPPADAPIGEYTLSASLKDKEKIVANFSVLFNPWSSDDWVFLPREEERWEYVLNEQGIIYRGGRDYISPMFWDFGQFEQDMVKICMKMLDLNVKHWLNPAEDVSARSNPIYVSRVVSAMVNSSDEGGVVMGNWGNDYSGGFPPTHWSGSYAILKQWYDSYYRSVRYGQCWVFAGIMCSVMRLLGIPCRVVTNFQSAHDTNKNLTIDSYFDYNGVMEKESRDSIWNFHVWVEGWMRRPDLATDGKYDGWQVVDPTPQERSEGLFCCGPASVAAIRNGEVNLKYDAPFVFAEVNADSVSWLVRSDGSRMKIYSDSRTVGQYISTKAVGSYKRTDITNSYKHREGTVEERKVFAYALDKIVNGSRMSRDAAGSGDRVSSPASAMSTVPPPDPSKPQLLIRFEEVSKPENGKDVNLRMILSSGSSATRTFSVNISVQAMKYTGQPDGNIQTEVTEQKLLPGKDLIVPIKVPFSVYHQYMIQRRTMSISAVITDLQNEDNVYLATNRVVLANPPLSITVSGKSKVNQELTAEVIFMNPINDTLRDCTMSLSGSGLIIGEEITNLPNLQPNNRFRITVVLVPYKSGERSLLVNFNCSSFRDIKSSCIVNIKP